MSKGPGRIQQCIADLIRAQPEGAWTTAALCRHIYDLPVDDMVEKKHRVAVIRAIRQMKLPPLWWVQRGSEDCLYNAGSPESTLRKEFYGDGRYPGATGFKRWKRDYPNRVEEAREAAAKAHRYHEASPVEKIDIDIAALHQAAVMWGQAGVTDQVKITLDRVKELQAHKTKLLQEA
jgi:hypothetical protein